jgi:putative transcriptional regulator
MSTENYFGNQFLVAMPALDDENFTHSVTLLCEHSERGALGLIINRPMTLKLREMLGQMELSDDDLTGDPIVYWGGPVSPERGFVIHDSTDSWDSTMTIGEDLFITTSKDILKAIGEGRGPRNYFVALGYANWGGGQLESEIMQNSWLNTPVDSSILFKAPVADRWKLATRLLGVDVTQLGGDAGHA